MRVLVGDDEPLARQRLIRLLQSVPDCEAVGEATNGREVLQQVQQLKPDVVLLDIRMPDMDGLEAAAHLQHCHPVPAVIFCTAYDEHALEAFKVHALDYLLKPVSRQSLEDTLARARDLALPQAGLAAAARSGRRQHISARTHKGLELIPLSEVRYFLADQKYVTVRFGGGEVLIDEPLKELEEEFADKFVRIHRNALISLSFLEGLELAGGGQYQVRLAGIDERLAVSRRHVAGLRKLIQKL
jgi:two-component system response regulator AlgR